MRESDRDGWKERHTDPLESWGDPCLLHPSPNTLNYPPPPTHIVTGVLTHADAASQVHPASLWWLSAP